MIFQNRRQESVDRGLSSASARALERLVAKEKLTDGAGGEALERIRGVGAARGAEGLRHRARVARPRISRSSASLLEALDAILGEDAIIATNTSSLSVTQARLAS